MMERNFFTLLGDRFAFNRFICVGLDTDYRMIPAWFRKGRTLESAITDYNIRTINATNHGVSAYKINPAFYLAHGEHGERAMHKTIKHIRRQASTVPMILDGKYGDPSDRTNKQFAEMAFEHYGVDAITIYWYPGKDALMPFLKYENKGIFVVCRTSNPGAGEFQDLLICGKPLYQHVAIHVVREWNILGNCGLVVGATHPQELSEIRAIDSNIPLLTPGIGRQGGDIKKTVIVSQARFGKVMIPSESETIIFPSEDENFDEEIKKRVFDRNQEMASCL